MEQRDHDVAAPKLSVIVDYITQKYQIKEPGEILLKLREIEDSLQPPKAVFVPTEYLECFGGVNVEARLSGTPVITTNFGCFPEQIENGIDGFRCNTLQDFVQATRDVEKLDPYLIRKRAERYLMDNVKLEYQKWFEDLHQVYLSTDGVTPGWNFVSKIDP